MRKAEIITKKIIRIGNSQGIYIPKKWLDEMGLEIEDLILLKKNDKIILDPNVPTHEEVHEEIKAFEKQLEAELET